MACYTVNFALEFFDVLYNSQNNQHFLALNVNLISFVMENTYVFFRNDNCAFKYYLEKP
jgi:hypothetical protein